MRALFKLSLMLLLMIVASTPNVIAQHYNTANPVPFYYYDYKLANPALVGLEHNHTMNVMYFGVPFKRSGKNYFPTSQTLYTTYETSSEKLKGGIGAMFNWQRLGAENYLSSSLLYSYKISVGTNKEIRIGTQLHYQRLKVNYGLYRVISPDDPLLSVPTSRECSDNFDMDFGAVYHTPKFDAGVSVKNVLLSEFQFDNRVLSTTGTSALNAFIQRKFVVTHWLDITPSVMLITDFERSFADVNAILQIKKWVLIGVGYAVPYNGRKNISFNIGLDIKDRVRLIAHIYSQAEAPYSAVYGTSIGAMVSVKIPKRSRKI